jgi:hypothetical protein
MDLIDLFVLLVECVVVGMGMAIGDWLVKLVAVRLLNSEQHALHDVEDDDEEETSKKKRRRAAQRPEGLRYSPGLRAWVRR